MYMYVCKLHVHVQRKNVLTAYYMYIVHVHVSPIMYQLQ